MQSGFEFQKKISPCQHINLCDNQNKAYQLDVTLAKLSFSMNKSQKFQKLKTEVYLLGKDLLTYCDIIDLDLKLNELKPFKEICGSRLTRKNESQRG